MQDFIKYVKILNIINVFIKQNNLYVQKDSPFSTTTCKLLLLYNNSYIYCGEIHMLMHVFTQLLHHKQDVTQGHFLSRAQLVWILLFLD